MGSPTVAGSYFAFMTPIALAVFLGASEARLRRLALAAAALGILALVLTLARGAWIALAVGVVVLALARRGSGRGLSTRAVVAGLAAVIVLVPTARLIETRLTASDQGSAAARVPLIRLAGQMIGDHPLLGVGANNFTVRLPDYAGPQFSSDWLRTVHNEWLLTWTDAGIGALMTLLAFVGVTIGRAWRVRRDPDPLVASAAAGIAAAVAGHAVDMNFDILPGRTTSQMLGTAAAVAAAPAFAASRPAVGVSAPHRPRHPTAHLPDAGAPRRPRAGIAAARSAGPG
jgi:O-antigen ligase